MAGAISKQEIRRNPLAEWLASTVRFVQTHRTAVLAAFVAAAVLGVTGGGYWWYQERREADAARALAGAYTVLRGGEPAEKPGVQDEAVKRLREVAEQHRGTRSAEEALIALGNLHYDGGKPNEALESYGEYLSAYPRGRFRMMAGLGKASGQEARGDLAGAAQTLSELLDRDKDNPLAGEAYMSLARVYEGLKKPEDAMRVYGEVAERFPNTNWAQDALQRMTAIRAK